MASQRNRSGKGAEDEPAEALAGEKEDESQAESQAESQEKQQRALTALAQMDLEAAEAYRIAADSFADRDVTEQLNSFREDHLKHVDNLERLITAMGGDELDREGTEESVLASLAAAASEMGPGPSLRAMIGNERLTNSTYESILTLEWEKEIKQVLQRNLQDEKRHLRWLEQNRDRFAEEDLRSPQP